MTFLGILGFLALGFTVFGVIAGGVIVYLRMLYNRV
jgi:hypothetical protein